MESEELRNKIKNVPNRDNAQKCKHPKAAQLNEIHDRKEEMQVKSAQRECKLRNRPSKSHFVVDRSVGDTNKTALWAFTDGDLTAA